MKIFCVKVLFFITLISCLFFSTISISNRILQNNEYYKLSSDAKYLFVGSSFVACGVIETEIDATMSFAMGGESFFYSYPKIRKIIEANTHLKYIFLDYSNFKITNLMDDYISTDIYLNSRYIKYSPLFDKDAKLFVLRNNPLGFLSIQPTILKNNILFLLKDDRFYPSYIHWGGYEEFHSSKIDSLIQVNQQNEATNADIFEIGETNLEYLLKIKEVCLKNGVNLILFRPPSHKLDPYRANEKLFQAFRKDNLSNISFLDFHDFPLEDNDFLDLGHLNFDGATKLSRFLNKIIKDSLWLAEDKQSYIDREIVQLQEEMK